MALTIAGMYPHVCEAVISESAQAFVENRTRESISAASEDFKNPVAFAKLQKYHGEKAQWVLDAWVKVWLSSEFANWSLKPALKKVTSPVLVTHGDQDEFGSLKFLELIAESVKGTVTKEIIENCGHVPHREKPELILTLVNRFLSSHLSFTSV